MSADADLIEGIEAAQRDAQELKRLFNDLQDKIGKLRAVWEAYKRVVNIGRAGRAVECAVQELER